MPASGIYDKANDVRDSHIYGNSRHNKGHRSVMKDFRPDSGGGNRIEGACFSAPAEPGSPNRIVYMMAVHGLKGADYWQFIFPDSPPAPDQPLPEGRTLSLEEALTRLTRAPDIEHDLLVRGFYHVAANCRGRRDFLGAMQIVDALATRLHDVESRSECLRNKGLLLEDLLQFEAAVQVYDEALRLNPHSDITTYFLNNNAAFCQIQLEHYEQAEEASRKAIAIRPDRHNAFKNLGLALEGQERYAEAVEAYAKAAELCPTDPRALQHLENLSAIHGSIFSTSHKLRDMLARCRSADRSRQRDSL
jgi:tetratricopeptide (TPR) repeat protein